MAKIFLDVECYKNYFLVCFKNSETGNTRYFEKHINNPYLDTKTIEIIMSNYTTVGFNSKNYDLAMIAYALKGASNQELKTLSDDIINSDEPSWKVARKYKIFIPHTWDHIDLMAPTPVLAATGLKMLGARMHTAKLQDLPFEEGREIDLSEHEELRTYCLNDVNITIELYNHIAENITLREQMSKIYGVDLRSKSDAQIAETVITKLIRSTGNVDNFKIVIPDSCYCVIPNYIKFYSQELNTLVNDIKVTKFNISTDGKVQSPEILHKKKVNIAGKLYNIGIGGLHSNDSHCATTITDEEFLVDVDVGSCYPAIILNNRLFPEHLGESFLTIYESFYKGRLSAKKAGDKVKSDIYKIILNGSFGKFGSIHSSLFSPDLLLSTTLTGQLSLLMLIEMVDSIGCSIISANTDGVTIKGNKSVRMRLDGVLGAWEEITKLTLDYTEYKAIYNEHVNSYIAITTDNKVKGKGVFAKPSLAKNPVMQVCTDAVVAYLQSGIEIEDYINGYNDIKGFLVTRKVASGAIWKGDKIGKVIRWYYAKDGEAILSAKKGDKVATSDFAYPLMELTDCVPENLDRSFYINKAKDMLCNLGMTKSKQFRLFN